MTTQPTPDDALTKAIERLIHELSLYGIHDQFEKDIKEVCDAAKQSREWQEQLKATRFTALRALAKAGVAVDDEELGLEWMEMNKKLRSKDELIEKLIDKAEQHLEFDNVVTEGELTEALQLAREQGYGKKQ